MIWVYKKNPTRWISTLTKENNYKMKMRNLKITWKIGMRKNLKWLWNNKKENINFKNPLILFVNFLSTPWKILNMVGSGFVLTEWCVSIDIVYLQAIFLRKKMHLKRKRKKRTLSSKKSIVWSLLYLQMEQRWLLKSINLSFLYKNFIIKFQQKQKFQQNQKFQLIIISFNIWKEKKLAQKEID